MYRPRRVDGAVRYKDATSTFLLHFMVSVPVRFSLADVSAVVRAARTVLIEEMFVLDTKMARDLPAFLYNI